MHGFIEIEKPIRLQKLSVQIAMQMGRILIISYAAKVDVYLEYSFTSYMTSSTVA